MLSAHIMLAGWVALGCSACLRLPAPPLARFASDGFHPLRDHYRVLFTQGGERTCSIASPEWALDNYELIRRPCEIEPRRAREYRVHHRLDHDADGRTDADSPEPRDDVLLLHRGDGTAMWIRTVPLEPRLEQRALDVLVHDYLDWLSGSTSVEIDLGNYITVRTRRSRIVRVVSEGPAQVAGQPAHRVQFDRIDTTRAPVDPSYVPEREELVVFRPGAHRWRSARSGVRSRDSWPMIVIVGISARADRLEAHRVDFESLLAGILLNDPPPGS